MRMSALYFLPLTMPRRVGVCLSLKFRVTSYTAVTVKYRIFCWEQIESSVSYKELCVCEFSTCALQTLQRGGEAFGSRQKVILEHGQAFTLCNLHADLVLFLCESSSLTVQQKLCKDKSWVYTHIRRNWKHSSLVTTTLLTVTLGEQLY